MLISYQAQAQIVLIFSGNLSFLNWLTIVPALACFDDNFWSKLLPRPLVRRAAASITHAGPSKPMQATAWIFTAVIALLSIQPALNRVSSQQIMNTSFDPLNLVYTYIPNDSAVSLHIRTTRQSHTPLLATSAGRDTWLPARSVDDP